MCVGRAWRGVLRGVVVGRQERAVRRTRLLRAGTPAVPALSPPPAAGRPSACLLAAGPPHVISSQRRARALAQSVLGQLRIADSSARCARRGGSRAKRMRIARQPDAPLSIARLQQGASAERGLDRLRPPFDERLRSTRERRCGGWRRMRECERAVPSELVELGERRVAVGRAATSRRASTVAGGGRKVRRVADVEAAVDEATSACAGCVRTSDQGGLSDPGARVRPCRQTTDRRGRRRCAASRRERARRSDAPSDRGWLTPGRLETPSRAPQLPRAASRAPRLPPLPDQPPPPLPLPSRAPARAGAAA